ncbi:MAG: thiamine diphosphokinase [Deltaproteobacteria bacterium]|jgi:thiamine pyrophosphokinase|nr:thiamine diphosphokinase [Deltaproteobacteria bacterium]
MPEKLSDYEPRIWLFLNGPLASHNLPKDPPQGLIMAADGGAKGLKKLGWPLDLLVGDLDSLGAKNLDLLPKKDGFRLKIYPQDKDKTDFELLLPMALDCLGPPGLVAIAGGLGGRWDMTLANLLVPFSATLSPLWQGSQIVFLGAKENVYALNGPTRLAIPGQRRFSLLPLTGPVKTIGIKGDVAYPLDQGHLEFAQTKGVSNETGPNGGLVTLEKGFVLVVVGLNPLSSRRKALGALAKKN